MPRRILYVAPLVGGETSFYRYHSLLRLKQEVIPFDVAKYAFRWGKLNALQYRYPVGPLVARVNAALVDAVHAAKPDVVWFDKPLAFTAPTLARIKETGALTVCYLQDNPFGPRHDGCWRQFYQIHPLFDLHCLFRKADVARYRDWGKNFIELQFSFDSAQQFPPPAGWRDEDRTREVSFVGSPHEDRPQFLRKLIFDYKLPVTLSGPNWNKVLTEEEHNRYVRGAFLKDDAYRQAIWQSKINLAFVTKLNEDDVAHKSFEITACGGFLLAERTSAHQAAFEEVKEAEFFSSVEECAEKIRYYLAHPVEREQIARHGMERAVRSGYDNDTQLARVVARLDEMLQGCR
jgi:spore maturation protein CgeB